MDFANCSKPMAGQCKFCWCTEWPIGRTVRKQKKSLDFLNWTCLKNEILNFKDWKRLVLAKQVRSFYTHFFVIYPKKKTSDSMPWQTRPDRPNYESNLITLMKTKWVTDVAMSRAGFAFLSMSTFYEILKSNLTLTLKSLIANELFNNVIVWRCK